MTCFIRDFPSQTRLLILPNPTLQNSKAINSIASFDQAMDGTDYSYIKSKTKKSLISLSFILSREKFLELLDFHNDFLEKDWEVTDHNGEKIIGKCQTNPLEGSSIGRSFYTACTSMGESYQVSIDIKGIVQ